MTFSRLNGILYPQDLEMLQRVFIRLCAEQGLEHDDSDAESLALQLVTFRSSGITDEAALAEAVRKCDCEPQRSVA